MRALIHWIKSYPMTVLERDYFTDSITGKAVGKYRDRHGVVWMATSRWATFRVESPHPDLRRAGGGNDIP